MNTFRYDKETKTLWLLDVDHPNYPDDRLHYTVSDELDKVLKDGDLLGENEFKVVRTYGWVATRLRGQYDEATELFPFHNRTCAVCGDTYGNHKSQGDFCPNKKGGYLETTFVEHKMDYLK